MENIVRNYSKIEGWGVDADPKNDPTYPIKHRTDEEQRGYTWKRPAQQRRTVEVLKSVERPNLPAVFGTAMPPKGFSGIIRRLAFRYSEGSFAHWIPLLIADRVNVVEGIIDDIRNGHFPNFFAERGGKATWTYNRKKIVRKALLSAAVLAGAIILIRRNKNMGTYEVLP